MDRNRFVLPKRDEDHLQELICFICDRVASSPTNCREDHVFCLPCIRTRLQRNASCPVDQAPLTEPDLSINRFMQRTIARLTVRCENRDAGGARAMVGAIRKRLRHPLGCRWEGPVHDLPRHQAECHFRCVTCHVCARRDIPLIGMPAHENVCAERLAQCQLCDARVLLREMPAHKDACPSATVFCPNHCLIRPHDSTDVTMLRREDVPAHLPHCPAQVVECEFHDLGCPFTGRRDGLYRHMEAALQQHVSVVRRALVEVRNHLGLPLKLAEQKEPMSPLAGGRGRGRQRPEPEHPRAPDG